MATKRRVKRKTPYTQRRQIVFRRTVNFLFQKEQDEKNRVKLDDIITLVSEVTGISVEQMESSSQLRAICDARAVAVNVAIIFEYGTKEIMSKFNRSHCAAYHLNDNVNSIAQLGQTKKQVLCQLYLKNSKS